MSPRPLLFIVGSRADTLYFTEDAYRRAKEPKKIHVVEGASHVDLYDKPEYVTQEAAGLKDFFRSGNCMMISRKRQAFSRCRRAVPALRTVVSGSRGKGSSARGTVPFVQGGRVPGAVGGARRGRKAARPHVAVAGLSCGVPATGKAGKFFRWKSI